MIKYIERKAKNLSNAEIHEMYNLFENYYVDISLENFRNDLVEKDYVLTFRDADRLVGFTTCLLKDRVLSDGREVRFWFSGDTVVDKQYWGQKFLQIGTMFFVIKQKLLRPTLPFYWMLISKGFKTYMLVRRNSKISFPNRFGPTPAKYQIALNDFYNYKFGSCYKPESDLIIFPESHGAVKNGFARPTESDLLNEEVKYFLEKNPNYEKGEELACIAHVTWMFVIFKAPIYIAYQSTALWFRGILKHVRGQTRWAPQHSEALPSKD